MPIGGAPRLYTPEMPISELRTAETVLVVTLRLRALHWRTPARTHPNWHDGLDAGNLPAWAISAFEDLFQVLAAIACHPLDIRGLHCSRLGFDEGQFLQTLGFFQHCQAAQAEATLRGWLSKGDYRRAAYPAASLACALERAALIIGPRDLATATEYQFRVNRLATRCH